MPRGIVLVSQAFPRRTLSGPARTEALMLHLNRLGLLAFLDREPTPSSCRLHDLDVMVLQQISCRVVQLGHRNLEISLRLNEI